jgi:hypothetical protein
MTKKLTYRERERRKDRQDRKADVLSSIIFPEFLFFPEKLFFDNFKDDLQKTIKILFFFK